MNDKLKSLYQSVILRHNNEPFHYEKKPGATHLLDAYNPLCGDRFQLFLEVKDGVIAAAHFHGYGCAISKASTSVLVKHLEGQALVQALEMCRSFLAMIEKGSEASGEEEFAAFAAARDFPGREKCATLSWEEAAEWLRTAG